MTLTTAETDFLTVYRYGCREMARQPHFADLGVVCTGVALRPANKDDLDEADEGDPEGLWVLTLTGVPTLTLDGVSVAHVSSDIVVCFGGRTCPAGGVEALSMLAQAIDGAAGRDPAKE